MESVNDEDWGNRVINFNSNQLNKLKNSKNDRDVKDDNSELHETMVVKDAIGLKEKDLRYVLVGEASSHTQSDLQGLSPHLLQASPQQIKKKALDKDLRISDQLEWPSESQPSQQDVTQINYEKIAKKQARFNNLKDDIKLRVLHTEIAKIYIGLKQKTRDSQELSRHSINSERSQHKQKKLTSQNERDIIMQLDFFVLIEYIKSAIDIIL